MKDIFSILLYPTGNICIGDTGKLTTKNLKYFNLASSLSTSSCEPSF